MDVTCQKCGVEYEFDDERITPEGVTVKCTSCGHIFKVKREVRVVTEPVMPAQMMGNDWMVRQSSGNVFNFKELTTLQRWIVERKVSRDDEISRTGKNWKRLGDIAELASFFQVVDDAAGRNMVEMQAMMAAQSQVQGLNMAGLATMMTNPRIQIPNHLQEPSLAPQAATAQPQQAQAIPLGQPIAQALAATQNAIPAVDSATTLPPGVAAPPQPAATNEANLEEAWQANAASDFLDDEDPVKEWQRRRRWPWILVILLLAVVAGGLALRFADKPTFDQLMSQLGIHAAPSPQVLKLEAQARRALAANSQDALNKALSDLEKENQANGGDPVLLALDAGLHLHLGEILQNSFLFSKNKYDSLVKEHPDGLSAGSDEAKSAAKWASQAKAFAEKSKQHFKSAAQILQTAIKADPNDSTVLTCNADFNRAIDKISAAKRAIERAKGEQEWTQLVRLRIAHAGQSDIQKRSAALDSFVQKFPANALARWLLAQDQILLKQWKKAKESLQAILDLSPGQQAAQNALKSIQAAETAKKEAENKEKSQIGANAGEQAKPESADRQAAKEPKNEPKLSFAQLLKRAERWRDRGNTKFAFKYYTKAAGLQPQRPEPRAGMGWCFLDDDKTAQAISSFRSALDLNSRHADSLMGLAESYRARGKNSQALKNYKRYLQVAPGGADAAVARRWVKNLASE